ncbi:BLUF domain-containing protein [Hymenobacter sp. ASUV-10]|uniref:BLUF domain-containing protein n=1 Tax=Hymenobacter aranciens TaxID=3063996 RepID=A0ABT9BCQ9_9BACT|nr:BLUF domain-containing protein [Hymenobacter sp. ASUV-10]MDO7875987.1 BLUF domain-containing protein [Hymenobacter sp. ASUV-10]
MHHLIYLSYAHQLFSDEELASLLVQSRQANKQMHITGVLMYSEGLFIQLLEGEKEVVHLLYARITQDPRHFHLVKLVDEAVSRRSFTEWSMAFQLYTRQQLKALAGYVSADQLAADLTTLGPAHAVILQLAKKFVFPDHDTPTDAGSSLRPGIDV